MAGLCLQLGKGLSGIQFFIYLFAQKVKYERVNFYI